MTAMLLNKIKQMYSNVKVRIVRSDAEDKEEAMKAEKESDEESEEEKKKKNRSLKIKS